ncbi:amidase family protein [Sphingomonas sp.]|uniref:amidase family protein n=1 Tax=Sphingomonas sp. TaxID=28214 RepID=UPI001EB1EE52|nr:amidase family protein [Sphingomonas sp.]MBX3594218.1 amidase [Sphingomonas sp.]
MADAHAPALVRETDHWAGASATDIAAAIRSGETSARAQCDLAIARIEAGDGAINAVVIRDFDRARTAADAADRAVARGDTRPLLGVPMTVKEAFDVGGLPTSWGFPHAADAIAASDAVAVARLKAAGAVILGKTNVAKALGDWQSVNPVHGRTCNPHDATRTPGGSSGGAAAALAAGFVPIELGSDIGGSIRVPAHFCGVWGHKPSEGALDAYGHRLPGTDGADPPLGVIGPMARHGADLPMLLDLLADRPMPRGSERVRRALILTRHPAAPTATAVTEGVERAARALARDGVEIVRDHPALPDLNRQHNAYQALLGTVWAYSNPTSHGALPGLAAYLEMRDEQARIARRWAALFEQIDLMLAPPAATQAFPHDPRPAGERTLDIDGVAAPYDAHLTWAGIATYPGLPATTVPVGVTGGLPTGAQVIAARYQDHLAIAAARRIAHLLDEESE